MKLTRSITSSSTQIRYGGDVLIDMSTIHIHPAREWECGSPAHNYVPLTSTACVRCRGQVVDIFKRRVYPIMIKKKGSISLPDHMFNEIVWLSSQSGDIKQSFISLLTKMSMYFDYVITDVKVGVSNPKLIDISKVYDFVPELNDFHYTESHMLNNTSLHDIDETLGIQLPNITSGKRVLVAMIWNKFLSVDLSEHLSKAGETVPITLVSKPIERSGSMK